MDAQEQSTGEPPTAATFNNYLNVVNRAIEAHKSGLYGKYAKLWERIAGDKKIAVGVYAKDASSPYFWSTVELQNARVTVIEQGKAADAAFEWKISEEHLRHVVDHPETYVEHPVKLDLDWLATRFGIS